VEGPSAHGKVVVARAVETQRRYWDF
jgi:hypothetical protein